MGYFAKINEQGIVEQVIVADTDVIEGFPGVWVETFIDDPAKRYAGIGDGWNEADFLPQPFDSSEWDAETKEWVTPAELSIVGNASPIITANGVDFVTIYLIGSANNVEEVLINDEPLEVVTDKRGYGEFELATDTPGLITVEWGGFSLEVAAL